MEYNDYKSIQKKMDALLECQREYQMFAGLRFNVVLSNGTNYPLQTNEKNLVSERMKEIVKHKYDTIKNELESMGVSNIPSI